MIPSMSRPGNPYDNASCESFMKTLKREEIYANDYRDLEHLIESVEVFIQHYYNRCRLHSALGYRRRKSSKKNLEQGKLRRASQPRNDLFQRPGVVQSSCSGE